ncbi:F-box/kelch-repeat protein At3g23880-like [Quercus robur]|uniref:F-box/kelch-repeat protein At3g23880-like n=1 Tax=Quercus robur TaxID=38942 RepID=UPI002161A0E1|nr:F-box/kelch-repeat protein At3g23880-like [Quercus robur]
MENPRIFSQNIPKDIVHDVLKRLPVKSLQRFKSVCETWCSLISSSEFAKARYDRANEPNNNMTLWRCGCIEQREDINSGVFSAWLNIIDYNGFMLEAKSLDSFIVGRETPEILGSCNNLLLVYCCFYLYLWNPSSGTHDMFELDYDSTDYSCGVLMCGLGYDSSSDDYKAVLVSHTESPPGSPNNDYYTLESFSISTYSFRTNTLKEIDDNEFPYNFDSDTQGVTLNGAPHWVLRREEYNTEVNYNSIAMVLVYFDPAKEHFYELPLPCMLDKHYEFELGVLGGCLSLTCDDYDPSGSHFETWVMKKYGVEESWEKLFVIPYFEEHLRPLCFTKNGDVLMEANRKKIVIYNLLNNSKRTVIPNIESNYCGFGRCVYNVDSMVLPYDEQRLNLSPHNDELAMNTESEEFDGSLMSTRSQQSDGKRQKRENKCKNKMRSLSTFARFNIFRRGLLQFSTSFWKSNKRRKNNGRI